MKNLFIAIFTMSLLVFAVFGQDSNKNLTSQQIKSLESIAIQDVPKDAPGIATGVVKNGKIIYEKYAGFADLKAKTPIGKDSRFNIASNGKQFTAFAALILIEEKKLNLDDDIRKFYPKLYPKIKSKITIENLLTHTSGIRDFYDLLSLQGITWWEQTDNNKDVLDLLHKQNELNFVPGSKYYYSNSNYILLAEIVGKVAGKTFREYTDEMFKKLNMPNTSFESNYKKIREPVAKPYFNFDTWFGYDWITNIHGDGNIFSTLEDQLEWEKTVQTKKNKFYSAELIEKSQQLIPNSKAKNYGYGLEFGKYRNVPYTFHGGSTGAWKAVTYRFPKENTSIITIINSGKIDPTMQTRQTADVLLGFDSKKKSYPIKPKKAGDFISIDDVVGTYQTKGGYIFQFEKRGGKLYLVRFGRNDIEVVREADNIFQQWNDAAFKQEFKKNEKGEMQITAYYTTHAPYTLTRIDSDWKGFDFNSLDGKFTNTETDVTFEIKHVSDKTYEIKIRDKKRKGLLLSPKKLLVNNYSLEIKKDKDGAINEMLLNSNRIQKVRFSRNSE